MGQRVGSEGIFAGELIISPRDRAAPFTLFDPYLVLTMDSTLPVPPSLCAENTSQSFPQGPASAYICEIRTSGKGSNTGVTPHVYIAQPISVLLIEKEIPA